MKKITTQIAIKDELVPEEKYYILDCTHKADIDLKKFLNKYYRSKFKALQLTVPGKILELKSSLETCKFPKKRLKSTAVSDIPEGTIYYDLSELEQKWQLKI